MFFKPDLESGLIYFSFKEIKFQFLDILEGH